MLSAWEREHGNEMWTSRSLSVTVVHRFTYVRRLLLQLKRILASWIVSATAVLRFTLKWDDCLIISIIAVTFALRWSWRWVVKNGRNSWPTISVPSKGPVLALSQQLKTQIHPISQFIVFYPQQFEWILCPKPQTDYCTATNRIASLISPFIYGVYAFDSNDNCDSRISLERHWYGCQWQTQSDNNNSDCVLPLTIIIIVVIVVIVVASPSCQPAFHTHKCVGYGILNGMCVCQSNLIANQREKQSTCEISSESNIDWQWQ